MATVSTKFFNPNMAAADMKALYKTLAKQNHPDLGGDLETMKLINAEYAYWYATVSVRETREMKNETNPASRDYYDTYYNNEFIEELERMINWIYNNDIDRIQGIEVNVNGVFIWIRHVSVEMREVQFKLKSNGFKCGFKKLDDGSTEFMWYWTHLIKKFGTQVNYNEIERKYGSTNVNRKNTGKNSRKQIGS